MMAVSASGASSAPLASLVKYVPVHTVPHRSQIRKEQQWTMFKHFSTLSRPQERATERWGDTYLYAWPNSGPGRWWSTEWWRPPQPPLLRSVRDQDRAESMHLGLENKKKRRLEWCTLFGMKQKPFFYLKLYCICRICAHPIISIHLLYWEKNRSLV